MQFAPLSSSAKGSANRRALAFGVFGFEVRRLQLSTTAVSTGGSAGSTTGWAGCGGDGSHIGMTCTVGCAGSGATGCTSCCGRGTADVARNPSGQVSARTLQGVGRGWSSIGRGLSRRTWTTSTTLLLPLPKPLRRGALTMKRLSTDAVCAPGLSWRGKTRFAPDIGFHMEWVLSFGTRRLRHKMLGYSVPSLC